MGKSCTHCGETQKRIIKGYCEKCYKRQQRHGDPSITLTDRSRPPGSTCSECDEPIRARGYCKRHWRAWRLYGDPNFVARPPRLENCVECGEPTLGRGAKGYCGKCYQRQRKYGNASDSVLQRHPRKGTMCTNCGEPVNPSSALGYCDRCYKRWQVHGDPSIVLPPSPPPVIRKYALNQEYFDNISTPEQAYWLGFIAADGNVTDSTNGYVLQMNLAEKDAEHVRLFAQALGTNKSPQAYRKSCNGIYRTYIYLQLHSRHLVESLARLGIAPRKSATAEPWDGPPDLMPHYWRGLFDGDGCMCRSRGSLYVTLVGSEACVEGFAAWGRPICGSRAKTSPTSPGSPCWKWPVSGKNMPMLLVRALYEDAPVALRRKQQLAEEILAG